MRQSCNAYSLSWKSLSSLKPLDNSLHHLYLIVDSLYFSGRYRAVRTTQECWFYKHNRVDHFHQLWHFALSHLFSQFEKAEHSETQDDECESPWLCPTIHPRDGLHLWVPSLSIDRPHTLKTTSVTMTAECKGYLFLTIIVTNSHTCTVATDFILRIPFYNQSEDL